MNTPSPLIPQGALPNARGKSHIRLAVITILAVHVVLLLALLMAGCKKTSDQAKNEAATDPASQLPPFDPNAPPIAANPPAVVPPTNTAVPAAAPAVTTAVANAIPATPLATGEGTEHTVTKGDSFYTVAKKYNLSINAIKAANPGVDSTKLKIGQKLKIPAASATPALAAGYVNDTASAVSSGKVYTVKSGDNLTKIAKLNEVSVKSLRAANNLKTDQVKVGQKLKIPAKGSTPEPVAAAAAAGGTGTNL